MRHKTIFSTEPHPRRARIPLAATGAVRALAAVLLLGVLPAGCTKEPAESGPWGSGDRIEIMPVVSLSYGIGVSSSGAPSAKAGGIAGAGTRSQTGMARMRAGAAQDSVWFARADQDALDVYGAYGPDAHPAALLPATGEDPKRSLAFDPKQYYLPSGKKTRMVGWHPKATAFTEGVVSWTFDGTQDIMTTAAPQEGSKAEAMAAFTFKHRLTQLRFFVYAEDAAAQALWGEVRKIEVTGQRNACTFTLAPDGADGAVAFTGDADQILTLTAPDPTPEPEPTPTPDPEQPTPDPQSDEVPGEENPNLLPVGKEQAVAFSLPMMIEPQASDRYELTIRVYTDRQEPITATISARAYPEGRATRLNLNFTHRTIVVEPQLLPISEWVDASGLTVADWDNNGQDDDLGQMTEAYPYVLEGKYVVSADLWGSSGEPFNDNWTGDNMPAHTVDDPDKNTVSRKLEVATANAPGGLSGWAGAMAKCASYLENGSGWRLPTCEELKLIYTQRDQLTATGIKTGPVWCWSSTETDNANAMRYTVRSGYSEVCAKTEKLYVRCVRDWGARSPYVKDGKYIVFQDQDGAYAAPIHANWTAADMPVHTETDDANSVPRQLEIAQSNASTGMTWEKAKTYCQYYGQSVDDGGGWRLPTLRELDWIYRRNIALSVIKVDGFIWSGTNVASSPDTKAWSLNFGSDNGTHNQAEKTAGGAVRCVRDLGALSHPYVLNGNTIVFKDSKGEMPNAQFHDPWNSDKNECTKDEGFSVSRRIRISGPVVEGKMAWTAAWEACRAYSEIGHPAGNWRLPTAGEWLEAFKMKTNLTNDAWAWGPSDDKNSPVHAETYKDYMGTVMKLANWVSSAGWGHNWFNIDYQFNVRCVLDEE